MVLRDCSSSDRIGFRCLDRRSMIHDCVIFPYPFRFGKY